MREEEEEGEEMRRKEEVTKGAASASGRGRDARTRRSIDPRLAGLGVNLISWSSLSVNGQKLLFLGSTIFVEHFHGSTHDCVYESSRVVNNLRLPCMKNEIVASVTTQ